MLAQCDNCTNYKKQIKGMSEMFEKTKQIINQQKSQINELQDEQQSLKNKVAELQERELDILAIISDKNSQINKLQEINENNVLMQNLNQQKFEKCVQLKFKELLEQIQQEKHKNEQIQLQIQVQDEHIQVKSFQLQELGKKTQALKITDQNRQIERNKLNEMQTFLLQKYSKVEGQNQQLLEILKSSEAALRNSQLQIKQAQKAEQLFRQHALHHSTENDVLNRETRILQEVLGTLINKLNHLTQTNQLFKQEIFNLAEINQLTCASYDERIQIIQSDYQEMLKQKLLYQQNLSLFMESYENSQSQLLDQLNRLLKNYDTMSSDYQNTVALLDQDKLDIQQLILMYQQALVEKDEKINSLRGAVITNEGMMSEFRDQLSYANMSLMEGTQKLVSARSQRRRKGEKSLISMHEQAVNQNQQFMSLLDATILDAKQRADDTMNNQTLQLDDDTETKVAQILNYKPEHSQMEANQSKVEQQPPKKNMSQNFSLFGNYNPNISQLKDETKTESFADAERTINLEDIYTTMYNIDDIGGEQ